MVLEHCMDNADDCFMWATSIWSWQTKFMEPYSDQERGNQCAFADVSRSARANCHFCTMRTCNRYLLCILSITSLWPCCLENLSCLLADWKALGARSRNPIFPSARRTWCMLLRCWVYNWGTAVAVVQNLYFCCNKAFFTCTYGLDVVHGFPCSLKIKKMQVSMHVLSCRSKFAPSISYWLRLADLGSINVMSSQLAK